MVIDVLRAFTTAAYASQAGTPAILLAGDVESAQALRSAVPRALVLSDGPRRDDVELVNSPALIRTAPLGGRPLIMTTTNGTRAALDVPSDSLLLCASFANARATAGLLRSLGVEDVAFVSSGGSAAHEDIACADYLAALAHDPGTPPELFLDRAAASAARHTLDRRVADGDSGVHENDVEICLQANRVSRALVGVRVHGTVMLVAAEWQAVTDFNC